ncbi:cadherin-3-like [Simochromis diagramma]|uniref:cadherin-3-like n=1 Tax=Simochromis diagramma TaxID=43689 RepID=UPI001A7EAD55|nr:cadherin-3-like [Simochromis diagramma]
MFPCPKSNNTLCHILKHANCNHPTCTVLPSFCDYLSMYRYKIMNDPAGWLNVDKDTGLIKVRRLMDREAPFVTNNRYIATIGAYDDDAVPATGTGTLIILLEDVNDNAPVIEQREIKVCNKDPAPQLLSVTDKDGPEFGPPYSVSLLGMSKTHWTARMNDSRTGIILNLATELPSGDDSVIMRVADKYGLAQDIIIKAEVCNCRGEETTCFGHASNVPLIRGILGGGLLLVLVLVVLFVSLRKEEQKEPTSKDNIFYYNREQSREDDQNLKAADVDCSGEQDYECLSE